MSSDHNHNRRKTASRNDIIDDTDTQFCEYDLRMAKKKFWKLPCDKRTWLFVSSLTDPKALKKELDALESTMKHSEAICFYFKQMQLQDFLRIDQQLRSHQQQSDGTHKTAATSLERLLQQKDSQPGSREMQIMYRRYQDKEHLDIPRLHGTIKNRWPGKGVKSPSVTMLHRRKNFLRAIADFGKDFKALVRITTEMSYFRETWKIMHDCMKIENVCLFL